MPEEKINPIKVTDKDTGEVYVLDFSRESVKFMANNDFVFDMKRIIGFIAVEGPELFFYAMRANHKKVARNQADKLYEKMGGLTPKMIARLYDLYNQTIMSNKIVQDDEDLEANPHVDVEF